jgi:hypothetical protein
VFLSGKFSLIFNVFYHEISSVIIVLSERGYGGRVNMLKRAQYKVWWDEKEEIIRGKFSGDFDEEAAKNVAEAVTKLAENRQGGVLVLNDVIGAGTASSGARKVYAELGKNEKIERIAFIGLKTFTRVVVSFISVAAGKKNIAYFNNETEALKWLKQG